MRPERKAFDRVRTSACWPISASKVPGRYFRARTRYLGLADTARCEGLEPAIGTAGEKRWSAGRPDAKRETEATTRAETRYGCFLPDLTGLARSPSAVSLPNRLYQPRHPSKQETSTGRLRRLLPPTLGMPISRILWRRALPNARRCVRVRRWTCAWPIPAARWIARRTCAPTLPAWRNACARRPRGSFPSG